MGSRDRSEGITAAALMRREITPPRFVIQGLLPEGLSILAAKPKTGKSWMALAAAVAVSNGSEFLGLPARQGEVLYLSLEDTLPRLRTRLSLLCQSDSPSDDLHLHVTWPRLDDGGAEKLEAWLKTHRRARLVLLDTLAKVSPRNGRSSYTHQYEMLAALKAIADSRRVSPDSFFTEEGRIAATFSQEISRHTIPPLTVTDAPCPASWTRRSPRERSST